MGYFKIKNITNTLGKRDINKDRELSVEYNIGFTKKVHKIKSGDELIISSKSLPVSAHQLRLKGLATVVEISENEFIRLQKPSAAKKKVVETKKVEPKVSVDTTSKTSKEGDEEKEDESKTKSSSSSKTTSKTKKSTYSTVKSDSDD